MPSINQSEEPNEIDFPASSEQQNRTLHFRPELTRSTTVSATFPPHFTKQTAHRRWVVVVVWKAYDERRHNSESKPHGVHLFIRCKQKKRKHTNTRPNQSVNNL